MARRLLNLSSDGPPGGDRQQLAGAAASLSAIGESLEALRPVFGTVDRGTRKTRRPLGRDVADRRAACRSIRRRNETGGEATMPCCAHRWKPGTFRPSRVRRELIGTW